MIELVLNLLPRILPELIGPVHHRIGDFSWFHLVPGVADDSLVPGMLHRNETWVILAAWTTCAVVVLLGWMARRGLDKARAKDGLEALVPDRGFTPRNVFEIITENLFELVASTMDRENAKVFFPFLGALFLYILVSNLMGLVPGFLPATSSVSNNLALAVMVFVTFNVAGLWRNGLAYIKHLGGPVLALAWFFFVIETIGLFVRPISLTLRLAGNMFGDHMVFGIISELFPWFLPSALLGLGAFVSCIQALVFMLLTTVYISLAVAHLDDH